MQAMYAARTAVLVRRRILNGREELCTLPQIEESGGALTMDGVSLQRSAVK